jgi:Cys-tRNA(Pro)/Cys-tRNA(Cys) deacylase
MSKSTRATQMLTSLKVAFTLHQYDYDPDAQSIGLHAAASLNVDPQRMLKTLMVSLDGKPACAIVPSDQELSLKKLAAASKGKTAAMLGRSDAERVTGYHIGGISPFGQKKRIPAAIHAGALAHPTIFVNGGQRGLQIELSPGNVVRALGAIAADLTAD